LQKEVEFYGDIRAGIKRHSGEELDIKPYEADMRRLLNTYVQADPAADVGNLSSLSLTDLIIKTGIHDAIARRLNQKGKLSKNAIAEGIINNVRKTIIRDQLTDPRFYAEMSALLEDLIQQSRADAAAYEAFLRMAEDLVKRMAKKDPIAGLPAILSRQARGHRDLSQPSRHPGQRVYFSSGGKPSGAGGARGSSRTFATGHFESDKPQQTRGSQVKGLHYIGSVDRSACWVVILGRGCSGNTNRNRSISNLCSADGSV
jgi:hypothetical protein